MNRYHVSDSATEVLTDELSLIELRIAQRADRLISDYGTGPEMDRERWLHAEREEWALTGLRC